MVSQPVQPTGSPRRFVRSGRELLYRLIQPQRIPERPRPQPRLWVEILITLLGLLGWGVFVRFHDTVSPTAALDLRYDRAEIAQMAGAYLAGQGFDLQGYRRVITFERDFMAQIYLERTIGVAQLNQQVRAGRVPVWTWHVRWFLPQEPVEYSATLLPTGEIVGFGRTLAEDAPGAALSPAEAQRTAEEYLTADRGLDLAAWELYDTSAETLPHRTDHTLTWVRRDLDVGQGDVRISVTVQGDRVGRFKTWFRVPEAFSRRYAAQRSRASLLRGLAFLLAGAFLGGGALVVFWGLMTGLRIGRLPLLAGLAVGLVDMLDSLNQLPLIGAGYNTATDYRTYLFNWLFGHVIQALFLAFLVAFLTLAGRWLVRAVWPRQHKLKLDPRAPWSHLARSSWRGMMLGGLMGAYLVLFYTIADRLGAWSPLDTPALNLLATPIPFIAAVWLGLFPALSEELTYRALGIGLVLRLSRGRLWLALLVPALLWGFAHAGYVTDPISLRGIELTISALLLTGPFFLLFDLPTTIVAHYTYNASLIALILVRSGKPIFVLTGLAAALLGLIPAAVVLVRRLLGRRAVSPPEPVLVEGGPADWPEVQALGGEPPLETDAPRRLLCLRSAEGELLGYALGVVERSPGGEPVGRVQAIFVAAPYRGRYYGSALYRALAAWFAEQGVDRVEAQVPLGNGGAATFWSTHRFRPLARLWVGDAS